MLWVGGSDSLNARTVHLRHFFGLGHSRFHLTHIVVKVSYSRRVPPSRGTTESNRPSYIYIHMWPHIYIYAYIFIYHIYVFESFKYSILFFFVGGVHGGGGTTRTVHDVYMYIYMC
jgi:hypothetical protein